MKIEFTWERHLNQSLNRRSVKLVGNKIVFVEGLYKKGGVRLSCCHIVTGEHQWSVSVPDAWGWTELHRNEVHYLSQSGELIIIDLLTGSLLRSFAKSSPITAYLIPTTNTIVTGGWRGYSDLIGLDNRTLQIKWTVSTRQRELQNVAVPFLLAKDKLLLAHHTKGNIEIRESDTGALISKHDLPNEFESVDLNQSCQMVGDQAMFLSKSGLQLLVDPNSLAITTKQLNIKRNETVLVHGDNTHFVYSCSNRKYALYDRVQDRELWNVPIESNMPRICCAQFLSTDHVLLAGSLGQLKIVDSAGKQTSSLKSYDYIKTTLLMNGQYIVFGTRSKLVAMRWSF